MITNKLVNLGRYQGLINVYHAHKERAIKAFYVEIVMLINKNLFKQDSVHLILSEISLMKDLGKSKDENKIIYYIIWILMQTNFGYVMVANHSVKIELKQIAIVQIM